MPTFKFEAMNHLGQPVKDQVEAASSDDAIGRIRAMGYFPTNIREAGAKKGKPQRGAAAAGANAQGQAGSGARRTAGRIANKLLTQFTRQLSTLVNAGLPILRCLRVLEEQQKPGMMRVACRMVAQDVEGGASLSEAMAKHPKAFDRLYVNMVRAGEAGGVLEVILQRLADFKESAQALKRKVIGAMVYPVAVMTFALAIVTALLIWVVPQFAKIFGDMKVELPAVTKALLALSAWVSSGGWIVILGSPLIIFAFFQLLKLSDGGRYFTDALKLKIPILGAIAYKSAVARFTRTLGTLLEAGVPILDAITITAETAGNEVYTRALKNVRDSIRQGETFAQPLRQAKVVEAMVVNMIDVGEETGELDTMLDKIADTYEAEVDTLVSSMTSLLEPVMVITLGGIVGFIVLALFMPMVSLIENVSQT